MLPLRQVPTTLALILLLLLTGCGSVPRLPDRSPTMALMPDPGTSLAKTVAASQPPGEHSGFRLMPMGFYSLDARIQLTQRAERSIDVQYYVLQNDATGRLLMRHLKEAAMRGVRVRILVDDLYTAGNQQLLLALSATPNIEVRLFNPFCCGRDGTIGRFVASLGDISRLNHRMHNKLFIVDGVAAIVGGRNIADEYFTLNPLQNFVDMDALVVGNVVPELYSIYDLYWNSDQAYPIDNLVPPPPGRARADEKDFDEWVGMALPAKPLVLPPTDLLGYGPIGEELDAGRMGLLWGTAHAFADPPNKFSSTGDAAYSTSVTLNVVNELRNAQTEVVLTSPYLIPGPRGMEAFEDLRARGVKTTVLTNSLAANDEPLVHTGYVRYRLRMLRGGVDLYELSPQRTTSNLRLGMFGTSFGRLHAKTVVIDRKTVFIGSMNLDPRSARQNTELGLLVESPQLAREMLRVINISKLQSAYRLRLDPNGYSIEWLTIDGEKEIILRTEPESSVLRRLQTWLLGPLVPESLL